MKLSIEPVTLRFRAPVATAFGTLGERELLRVELHDADGLVGVGEAAPLEAYDGVTLREAHTALEGYREVLERADAWSPAERYDALRDAADLPAALAAVDLAAWDLAGKRARRPVAELLADGPAARVPVNATIAAADRAGAASEAIAAVEAGFSCVKLKVGIGDDAGRVAAVRAAAGADVELRVDANGAWEVDEAVATIGALSPAGLELVEEPVHGIEELRAVRDRVAVRVAMDETAAVPGATASGAADAVCLKLSRCGGISGLLATAALVRATGAEPYVASTFDGPAGIAGALHAAAALRPSAACGLATLALFADLEDPFPPRRGAIAVPRTPGLGLAG